MCINCVVISKNITMHKVNLMVEDTSANSIDIALKENFEYKNINKSKIEYLLKDIRYKLIKNHPDKYIAHIIVKKCFLDGVEYKVSAGESIKINKEAKHRIQNPSDTILIFIEVQTGTYFGEDDIVRIEDDYNRI